MKNKTDLTRLMVHVILLFIMVACGSSGKNNKKDIMMNGKSYEKGTYGYDAAFLKKYEIETIELKDGESDARVLLAPGYQGRVMTSSASGPEGLSFGWINHGLIESGEISAQFNPVGGEERFWLGPEGGPFSIYFKKGDEQVYKTWNVPAVIDTEPFEVKEQNSQSVTFVKNTILENASGTEFRVGIERKVNIVTVNQLEFFFNAEFSGKDLKTVAYQSVNTLSNQGNNAWTKEGGLLSVWMLGMFSPSPSITVFIPYRREGDGKIVNDEYFGKVPSDRLIVENGVVYFKIDGAYRSKIGIPPQRARELCGSYDSAGKTLTLVWGSLPEEPKSYVNSNWGEQEDPFDGDAINAYNDGPVDDGSVMGPFYEIETSSPAADLLPGQSLTHTQVVAHIQGNEEELAKLVDKLFGLRLSEIASKFN